MSYIVTLEIDPENFAWLNELRRRHFPAERNFLDAHLTLFYHLNEMGAAPMRQLLETSVPQRVALAFAGVRDLGAGVAIDVDAPDLQRLRAAMVASFKGGLARQDAKKFQPHVTIQNKVPRERALALFEEMRTGFAPRCGAGTAVLFWKYLGGPWRLHRRYELTDG